MFVLLMSFLSIFASASSPDVDVYEPKAKAAATVIFIHGGAWQGGDKSEGASMASTFTTRGFRFVSFNYRLSSVAKHPAPVEDLNAALLSKYGDIFLVGHSAGAHMIAFWNTVHANKQVKGFIGVEGIYDLPALVKTWPTYKDWFIAKEFGTDAAKYAAASPALLPAKSKTPWMVIHSEKDELVDLAQSENFVTHMKKSGAPAELARLKTETHFGAIESLSNPESDASKAVLKFITKSDANGDSQN